MHNIGEKHIDVVILIVKDTFGIKVVKKKL